MDQTYYCEVESGLAPIPGQTLAKIAHRPIDPIVCFLAANSHKSLVGLIAWTRSMFIGFQRNDSSNEQSTTVYEWGVGIKTDRHPQMRIYKKPQSFNHLVTLPTEFLKTCIQM